MSPVAFLHTVSYHLLITTKKIDLFLTDMGELEFVLDETTISKGQLLVDRIEVVDEPSGSEVGELSLNYLLGVFNGLNDVFFWGGYYSLIIVEIVAQLFINNLGCVDGEMG